MRVKNPEEYILEGYEVANGDKKYNALLKHKKTGRVLKVGFGEKGYEQYKDKIGHYSDLDHKDSKRRAKYLTRHKNDIGYKYSSGWFSAKMLW